MKFFAVTLLALATGALAMPGGGPPQHNRPTKPVKPSKPPTNNQQISCGNDQSLYCCSNEGNNRNDVTCASFSNGGVGGICNGIQLCCNNNQGSQGCNIGTGGGTIIFTDNSGGRGHRLF